MGYKELSVLNHCQYTNSIVCTRSGVNSNKVVKKKKPTIIALKISVDNSIMQRKIMRKPELDKKVVQVSTVDWSLWLLGTLICSSIRRRKLYNLSFQESSKGLEVNPKQQGASTVKSEGPAICQWIRFCQNTACTQCLWFFKSTVTSMSCGKRDLLALKPYTISE